MQQALLLTLCSLALWSLRNRDVGWEWWSPLSWVLAGSMSTLPYPTFSQENLFTLRHVFWQPSQDFPLQVYMSESCGNIKKKTAMSQTSSQICKLLEASFKRALAQPVILVDNHSWNHCLSPFEKLHVSLFFFFLFLPTKRHCFFSILMANGPSHLPDFRTTSVLSIIKGFYHQPVLLYWCLLHSYIGRVPWHAGPPSVQVPAF